MKELRLLIIGLIAGALLATAGTSLASDLYEKITATKRADYKVELDGKRVELKNAPIVYDGSTYIPLRELSNVIGVGVEWNGKTQTVKLSSKDDSNQSVDEQENESMSDTEFLSLNQLVQEYELTISVGDGILTIDDKKFTLPKADADKVEQVTSGEITLTIKIEKSRIYLNKSELEKLKFI